MINPFQTNSLIDSCAFDPKYSPEDAASVELMRLRDEQGLGLLIAHSTLKEAEHPNTPAWVRREAQQMIYTQDVRLTPPEVATLRRIEAILAGNGKVENIAQDARHVFEAQKYGSYFITTDARLLKRAAQIRKEVSVTILRPSDFLDLALRSGSDASIEALLHEVSVDGYEGKHGEVLGLIYDVRQRLIAAKGRLGPWEDQELQYAEDAVHTNFLRLALFTIRKAIDVSRLPRDEYEQGFNYGRRPD
jgi:hypothetical protein